MLILLRIYIFDILSWSQYDGSNYNWVIAVFRSPAQDYDCIGVKLQFSLDFNF